MPPRSTSRSEQRRRKARAIGRHIAGKQRAAEKYEVVCAALKAFGNPPPPSPQRINYGCKQQPRRTVPQQTVNTLEGMDGLVAWGFDHMPSNTQPTHASACHYESNCTFGLCRPCEQQLPAKHRLLSPAVSPHIARKHAWQGHHAGQATNGSQLGYTPVTAQQQQQYISNGNQSNASALYVPHYTTVPNGATYFQSQYHLH